jgi:hypothetical protein
MHGYDRQFRAARAAIGGVIDDEQDLVPIWYSSTCGRIDLRVVSNQQPVDIVGAKTAVESRIHIRPLQGIRLHGRVAAA